MWSTTTGARVLLDEERKLLLGTIGVMVDHLVDELRNDAAPVFSGIDWFDQWDAEQRLWLLEQVVHAMVTDGEPPDPAAMLDATVDAVFCEIDALIEMEIHDGPVSQATTWRQTTVNALEAQTQRDENLDVASDDLTGWKIATARISGAILGVRVYQQAESHRDGEPHRLAQFLKDKGLPQDYLESMPPVVRTDRAQLAIDRIQHVVFES